MALSRNGSLLQARALQKSYVQSSLWGPERRFLALQKLDLDLRRGSCTALIGSSGSGKTTLAGCLACLEPLDAGEIWFEGLHISKLRADELRKVRPRIQMVFQDASGSLNPAFTALELVEEPLLVQNTANKTERRARAGHLLQKLGIPRERHASRTHEFSGGQQRRIGLARALALNPTLMILDEVFSGLDLATSARILHDLLTLRAEQDLTLLFVSHDLTLLANAVDSIFVMHAGKIVEQGSTTELGSHPQHPSTRGLFSAFAELRGGMAKGAAR